MNPWRSSSNRELWQWRVCWSKTCPPWQRVDIIWRLWLKQSTKTMPCNFSASRSCLLAICVGCQLGLRTPSPNPPNPMIPRHYSLHTHIHTHTHTHTHTASTLSNSTHRELNCIWGMKVLKPSARGLSPSSPASAELSILFAFPIPYPLRLRRFLPQRTQTGVACEASGNLPSPQAVKLPVANNSSQYTKKGHFYSESS
jgi:hypothetical protein